MQKDDVARIAAGLTEAQRRAMVMTYRGQEATAIYHGDPLISTLRVLVKKGLLVSEPHLRKCAFTPLGLAVRNHLKENRDDQ